MARGFISGILWGGIAGVSALAILSVSTNPVTGPQGNAASSAGGLSVAASSDAGQPVKTAVASAPTAPQGTAGQGADVSDDDASSATASLPGVPQASAQVSLLEPFQVPSYAPLDVAQAQEVIRSPQALAPMTPAAPDSADFKSKPVAPPQAPVVADAPIIPGLRPVQQPLAPVSQDVALVAQTEDTTATTVEVAQLALPADDSAPAALAKPSVTVPSKPPAVLTELSAPPAGATVPSEPPAVLTEWTAPPAVATVPSEPSAVLAELAAPPAVLTAPADPPAAVAPRVAASQQVITLVPVAPPAAVINAAPRSAGLEVVTPVPTPTADIETASALPRVNSRIGTQVGSLLARDTQNGVVIRRPGSRSLGEEDEGIAEDVVAQADTTSRDDSARPVQQFAATFTPDADKPLMSIVLIDDGSSPVSGDAGIAALRDFPYALSFAVDANLPDAADRMEMFRNEGFEVLAMVDLPQGAQPGDAEIAFGAILPELDKVVGVLEGTRTGFQGSRDVADQVTSILVQTGHGLLTQDNGLNTMPKLARKEGVPADAVFRDFDSKGQTAKVMRRFLDQAAFKAGQEGAVVMLGRLRAETISALLLWGLQDRAGKVSLAPISAVLLRDQ